MILKQVKLLQFEKSNSFFRYKTSYKQGEWDCVEFRSKKRRTSELKPLKNIQAKPAYTKKISLADNKKKDLKSLVDTKIIPGYYKPFFDSITSN